MGSCFDVCIGVKVGDIYLSSCKELKVEDVNLSSNRKIRALHPQFYFLTFIYNFYFNINIDVAIIIYFNLNCIGTHLISEVNF